MVPITVGWDWKEPPEESVEEIVKYLGGYIYPHPDFEGSDSYGYIISRTPLTEAQIQEHVDKEWNE